MVSCRRLKWRICLSSLLVACLITTLCSSWAGIDLISVTQMTSQGKRTFHVGGKPTPLFWCYGLESPEDVSEYKAFGFNTVYVDVEWPQQSTPAELQALLSRKIKLVQAAERESLYCVIGIETAPETEPTSIGLRGEPKGPRVDPFTEDYARGLQQWLDIVTQTFSQASNVIGYGTQHDPRHRITLDEVGFRSFLKSQFGTVDELSRRWQVAIPDWQDIGLDLPALIEEKRKLPLSLPSLDIATYQWFTTRRMLDAWASELRVRDPGRLVFTGRIEDYKTLAAVPISYDGVVPDAMPGNVEVDLTSHNPHAIDIARRGGLLSAVPCLMTGPNALVREDALDRQSLWMKEAFLHGASGICFRNWADLKSHEMRRHRIRSVIQDLSRNTMFQSAPAPSSAIIYEPFAEGAIVNDDPLYGYLTSFARNEPSDLFFSYRRGTRYGQLDVIDHDALLTLPLSRYGSILAPSTLYLEPAAQAALAGYVQDGGVLVSDLGMGTYQSNGQLDVLTPPLQDIFGIINVTKWIAAERNFVFVSEHPLFPSIPAWSESTGNLDGGMCIESPIGITRLYADTIPFGVAMVEPKVAPLRRGRRPLPSEFSSISIRSLGRGYGVFAPFHLWSHWLPPHEGYQEFHGDLLSRQSVIELTDSPALFPDEMPNHLDDEMLGVECAAFADGYAFFNGGSRVRIANANAIGVSRFLFTDCDTTYSPKSSTTNIPPPHELLGLGPVFKGVDSEVGQLVHLAVPLQPGELKFCKLVPVSVGSNDLAVSAGITEYAANRIKLKAWVYVSPSVSIGKQSNHPDRIKPATIQVTVMSGDYKIEPRSRHQIRIISIRNGKTVHRAFAIADDHGVLNFEYRGVGFEFIIEPM